jgi:cytochrome b involved in lipid metabolism
MADLHPGGREIILECAGRDATDAFINNHEDWEKLLEGMNKVGRVVPPKGSEPIAENEIVFCGKVYRFDEEQFVQSLEDDARCPDGPLYQDLQLGYDQTFANIQKRIRQKYQDLEPHMGSDVTLLPKQGSMWIAEPLRYLEHLVVSHTFRKRELTREITPSELARHNRLNTREEEARRNDLYLKDMFNQGGKLNYDEYYELELNLPYREVWVGIEGIAYDVSGK